MPKPLHMTLSKARPEAILDVAAIPGVRVETDRGYALVPFDVAQIVGRKLGLETYPIAPPPAPAAVENLPGFERARSWQRAAAPRLASGATRVLDHATGSGKTATMIWAAAMANIERLLVFVPAMGRAPWLRDLSWCAPERRVAVLFGESDSDAARATARRASRRFARYRANGLRVATATNVRAALDWGADTLLVGYESLAAVDPGVRDAAKKSRAVRLAEGGTKYPPRKVSARAHEIASFGWNGVALDEIHMIKGRNAARTHSVLHAIKNIRWRVGGSATVTPDRLRDLWMVLHALDPFSWGWSYWKFAERYLHVTEDEHGYRDDSGPCKEVATCGLCTERLAELNVRLEAFCHRVRLTEIMSEMPAKSRDMTRVPAGTVKRPPPRERGFDAFEEAIGLAAEAKFDTVATEAASLIEQNAKVVVVGNRKAWVPRMHDAILRKLGGAAARKVSSWWTHGDDESTLRDDKAAAYQEVPECGLFVATRQSIIQSITLHQTDYSLIAALPRNPYEATQLEGRTHRLGGRNCIFKYYIAEETVDESIEESFLGRMSAAEAAGTLSDPTAVDITQVDESAVIERAMAWMRRNAAEIDSLGEIAE